MTTETAPAQAGQSEAPNDEALKAVVHSLLTDLKNGSGDKDKRRQVEDWMRSLSEKYPDFGIESGLEEYYLAEAGRLRIDFDSAKDISEKLALGRSIEGFLEKAAEYGRRADERKKS